MNIDELYKTIQELYSEVQDTTEPREICCMKLRLFDMQKILKAHDNNKDTLYIKELQYDYYEKYGGKINVV